MAKDSYWFKHDSTAGRGTRMRKMAFIYGHWGKGIYWDVLEILRDQDGYRFEKDEQSIQMLSDLIGCKDPDKLFNWLSDCIGLDLIQSDEKYFFSNVLKANMTKWESTKDAGIQSGKVRKERKLNETRTKRERTVNETRTKDEHNIIEDNIIEDNILKRENLTEFVLDDLENSSHLEIVCKRTELSLSRIKELIPEFKKIAALEYPTVLDLINHFIRWVNKNKTIIVITKPYDKEAARIERLRAQKEYNDKMDINKL